jgi:hypothetical protein
MRAEQEARNPRPRLLTDVPSPTGARLIAHLAMSGISRLAECLDLAAPKQPSMDPVDLESMLSELRARGWCFTRPDSAMAPAAIVGALGPALPSRGGTGYFDLVPSRRESAPFASMSAITGTGEQPMHTDAAYHPLPPRYIALQCLEPGEASCPTHVWALDVWRLKRDRPRILTQPNWVARGGGRAPFYCSVMEVQNGEARVRFDPLCMRTLHECDQASREANEILSAYSRPFAFEWERGALLLIDNWRCLHARGRGGDKCTFPAPP